MRLDTVMVSSLFLCIFWIHSPGTVSDYNACCVSPAGVVNNYGVDYYSCGRTISPGTDNNHRSYRVRSDGIPGIYDLIYGSSYGKFRSPGTGGFDANYAWNVDKSGNIPLFSDHENSYGHTFIRSPAIDTVADSIFYVATNGGAYISDYISTYSYGSPNTNFGVNVCYVDPAGVFGSGSYNNVSDSYGMHVYPLSGHELFKRRMEYFKFW